MSFDEAGQRPRTKGSRGKAAHRNYRARPEGQRRHVVSGAIRDAGPPAVARSRPLPLTPDGASYAAQTLPTADASSYNASLTQYRPRYDDNHPLLPFPFFFGR
jgi:hypothetical protein